MYYQVCGSVVLGTEARVVHARKFLPTKRHSSQGTLGPVSYQIPRGQIAKCLGTRVLDSNSGATTF